MTRAERYFRRGSFEKVVQTLEPRIFEHRTDWKFYSYLGYASLYTGDFIKANSYLQRALQLNPSATELMYGLAVLHLKRGETGDAVRLWLHILHQNPDDIYAKAGLDFVNSADSKLLPGLLTLQQCRLFLPCRENRRKWLAAVGVAAGVCLLAAAGAAFLAL